MLRVAGGQILAEGNSWFSLAVVKTCIDVLQDLGYGALRIWRGRAIVCRTC